MSLRWFNISLTLNSQSSLPKQSPVSQEQESPLTVQFVRPQTRPCQSGDTQSCELFPETSSNPPIPGPVPACVAIPGHIVVSHWLVMARGMRPFQFDGGPRRLKLVTRELNIKSACQPSLNPTPLSALTPLSNDPVDAARKKRRAIDDLSRVLLGSTMEATIA
jgi:hypothetical protein